MARIATIPSVVGLQGALDDRMPMDGNSEREASGALRAWRSTLSNRATAPAYIAALGASVTEGYNATAWSGRWVNQLPVLMRSRLGLPAGGGGFTPPFTARTYSSGAYPITAVGTVVNQTAYGLVGKAYTANGSANGWNISCPMGTTGVDFVYTQYTSGPTAVPYTVDGGGAVTFSTIGVKRGGQRATLRGLTPGAAHTIALRGMAGGSDFFFEGVIFYAGDESAGIVMIEGGQGGLPASTLKVRGVPGTNNFDMLNYYRPGLVLLQIGMNDYNTGVAQGSTPATFKTNVQIIIASIRRQYDTAGFGYGRGPSIVLVADWQRWAGGAIPNRWDEYVAALYEIAVSDKAGNALITVFDIGRRLNPYSSADNTAPGFGSDFGLIDGADLTHPTPSGHIFIADALSAFLIR